MRSGCVTASTALGSEILVGDIREESLDTSPTMTKGAGKRKHICANMLASYPWSRSNPAAPSDTAADSGAVVRP